MKPRRSCHHQLDLFVAKTPPAPISEASGAAAATEAGDEDHV